MIIFFPDDRGRVHTTSICFFCMKRILLLLLLALPCTLLAVVYPKNIPTKPLQELSISEINALFRSANVEYKKPEVIALADSMGKRLNGALLIAQNDEVIVKKAFGYTKIHSQTAANKLQLDSRFDLASVSKEFTSAAILQLVSAGKLSLQDSLRKFFPELPYSGITIHHLLCHLSGLPEYFNFPDKWYNTEKQMCNEDVVKVLVAQNPPREFAPGERFRYTNTNYALLALIVKQVSGQPFPEYVKQHIFAPAGMSRSFYITERSAHKDASIAIGHESNGTQLAPHFMDGTVGDKGLYSCVEDLFLWKKAFFNNYKILPKKWVDIATRQQNKPLDGSTPEKLYGYGFRLENNQSYGKIIYHGGLWHGFQHLILYQPQENIFLVFLSNYKNSAHKGKSDDVLRILCGA